MKSQGGHHRCPAAMDLRRGGKAAEGPQGTKPECCPMLALTDLGWERGCPLHDFVCGPLISVILEFYKVIKCGKLKVKINRCGI